MCLGVAAAGLVLAVAGCGRQTPEGNGRGGFRRMLDRLVQDRTARGAAIEEAPILRPDAARLDKQFRRDRAAWFQRAVVKRCFAGAVPPEFETFVNRAVWDLLFADEVAPNRRFAEIEAEARGWIEKGQGHPLTWYLQWLARCRAGKDAQEGAGLLKRAWEHPALAAAPPYLRFRIADALAQNERKGSVWLTRRFALMTECLADPLTYGPGDEEILVENCEGLLDSASIAEHEAEFRKWMAGSALTDWSRAALWGCYHIQKAWEARGSGYARKVTAEGWAGFAAQLAQARKHLETAWQINPLIPLAPAKMISVVMGERSSHDSCRIWFDRAVAAQFDYVEAYKSYLWSIRPRWGGSHARMLSFGRACANTRSFDTLVPCLVFNAVDDVEKELGDGWRSIYRDRELVDLLVATERGYLARPAPLDSLQSRRSWLAYFAWASGRYELAAEELKPVDFRFDADLKEVLTRHDVSPVQLRGEIVLATRGLLPQWEKTRASYEEGDLEEARRGLDELRRQLGGKEVPKMLARQEFAVQMEAALAESEEEWVPLRFPGGLGSLEVREGSWAVEPGDVLVVNGTGNPALLLFPGRVGPDLEIQGSWSSEPVDKPDSGCGVVVGFHGGEYVTCAVWNSGSETKGGLLQKFFSSQFAPKPVIPAAGRDHTFHVTVRRNQITFRFDGQVIASDAEAREQKSSDLIELPANSQAGIGTFRVPNGVTIRIRNLKIRSLGDSRWANVSRPAYGAGSEAGSAPTRVPGSGTVHREPFSLPVSSWKLAKAVAANGF